MLPQCLTTDLGRCFCCRSCCAYCCWCCDRWRVAGEGGKAETPLARVALCRSSCKSPHLGAQNPPQDVQGKQARGSRSPAANKCLYLQHLQAWSLLHIMEKIPLFAVSKDQIFLGWFVTLRALKNRHRTGRNNSPKAPGAESPTSTETRKFVICLQTSPFLHLPALELCSALCHQQSLPINSPAAVTESHSERST